MRSLTDIARAGLWRDNPGLVQLFGLCPLLAVTDTAVNGLALGLATAVVLACSNLAVSLTRRWLRPEIRIPAIVLVIASLVTAVELAMSAWFHGLYRVLGIFVPLIVTNCTILARAEVFASRNAPLPALVDGLSMGAGFAAVMVVLGGMRELVGHGTLFTRAHQLFGPSFEGVYLDVPGYDGFLLAVLAPGAFIGLGLLVAAKNRIDMRDAR